MPAGAYPHWMITSQYAAGDRVTYHGLPYQANWSNQGLPRRAGSRSARFAVAAAVPDPR